MEVLTHGAIAPDRPIVVVDDDELEFLIFSKQFAKTDIPNPLKHFDSGSEFLEFLQDCRQDAMPALVFLDVKMPEMGGHEVLATMRSQDRFKDVPLVLMLTNSSDPGDRSRALHSGANGYLVKPAESKGYLEMFDTLFSNAA